MDNELMTAVKDRFSGVQMDVPVNAVVRRGRSVRRRRRVLSAAPAAAIAAAVMVPATAGLLNSPPGARLDQTTVSPAAWTVVKNSDNSLTIKVRELKDAAGLQARLRAEGVPARVVFNLSGDHKPALSAGCVAPVMSDEDSLKVLHKIEALAEHRAGDRYPAGDPSNFITIMPSAIPHGIGIHLGVSASATTAAVYMELVRDTPECTGS